MSLEPVSTGLTVMSGAVQVATGAVQLSDSFIARLKIKRILSRAEEDRIRDWTRRQLTIESLRDLDKIDAALFEVIVATWERCENACCRLGPSARPRLERERDAALGRAAARASEY